MRWYLKALRQYADFNGRAQRAEFWMFTLISTVISLVLAVLDHLLGLGGRLPSLYGLLVLLPSLAVTARRLHDIGRSGWWMFLGLVPVVGWVITIVWYATDGTPQPNIWGANPKLEPVIRRVPRPE